MAVPERADGEEGDEDQPWDDWWPKEQTASDALTAAEEAKALAPESDDEWCPEAQGAAAKGGEGEESEEEDEEENSDDDWNPQEQGASNVANVAKTEQEALMVLLKAPDLSLKLGKFETKKEADAFGKQLCDLRRPPTMEEAKEEVPRGPNVQSDKVQPPRWRDMTEDEAIEGIMRGANPMVQGMHGRHAMHKAVELAHPQLCKALVDAKADVDVRDHYGETPLLHMSHTGPWHENIPREHRSETILTLLELGADIYAVNPRGRNCLHLACTENDYHAIEMLVEGMANVNAQDLAGFTPLIWAAGRGGKESVRALLDYEADMTIKANRGQTAMTFALTNGNQAVVDILQEHKQILDREEAKRIADGLPASKPKSDIEPGQPGGPLAVPKPAWACTVEAPATMEPYAGRRVYMQAKPDRRSNVY